MIYAIVSVSSLSTHHRPEEQVEILKRCRKLMDEYQKHLCSTHDHMGQANNYKIKLCAGIRNTFSYIIECLTEATSKLPPERIDEIERYWKEHDCEPRLTVLRNAVLMDQEMAEGGMLDALMLGRTQKKMISDGIKKFVEMKSA